MQNLAQKIHSPLFLLSPLQKFHSPMGEPFTRLRSTALEWPETVTALYFTRLSCQLLDSSQTWTLHRITGEVKFMHNSPNTLFFLPIKNCCYWIFWHVILICYTSSKLLRLFSFRQGMLLCQRKLTANPERNIRSMEWQLPICAKNTRSFKTHKALGRKTGIIVFQATFCINHLLETKQLIFTLINVCAIACLRVRYFKNVEAVWKWENVFRGQSYGTWVAEPFSKWRGTSAR